MNLYLKFYLQGLLFVFLSLLFSLMFMSVSSIADLTIAFIIFLMLPYCYGKLNEILTNKLYKIKIKTKHLLLYLDGLTLMLFLLPLSYFLGLVEYSNSSLLILIVNLVSPLIFGFVCYKITEKIYETVTEHYSDE